MGSFVRGGRNYCRRSGGIRMKLCSVLDCGIPASTRGLCKKHYMRFRRHGDPGIKKRPGPRRDLTTAILLEQFPEQSKRTRAHIARADSSQD